nr:lipocalin family protein [Parabacteroides pacaensis]
MTAVVFTACTETTSIEGKWVEPVPGMENQMQGINLEKGGRASSINMATLQYEKWEKKGDKLILTGKSIGNHQTLSFSDTLTIKNCSNDKLELKKGSLTINYQKQR